MPGGRYHTVEQNFHQEHLGCGCPRVERAMSSPADCEPGPIGLVNLLWSLSAFELPVLHVFESVERHLILSNEDARVVWVFNPSAYSLEQPAELVG